MVKLLKYMKPFVGMLGLAVLLLFGQAMADLALPDYMSDIVNVGLQQGGNDQPLPSVLRESDKERLELFLVGDEAGLLDTLYEVVEEGTSDYDYMKEDFSNTLGETLHQLKDLDSVTKEQELSVSSALLVVTGIQQAIADADGEDIEMNGMTIPSDTDIFGMMVMMPEEARAEMMEESGEQFSAIGDDMLLQAGSSATLVLYEDMGADIESMRQNYILKIGAIMLGITVLGALASIAVGFIAARIAAALGRNLRSKLFEKVSQFSNREFDKFSTASLITRSTNDVMQIQNLLVILIRMVFYAPILGIGGILKALESNASMSWIIGLAVGFLISVIAVVFIIAMPKFKLVQKLVDKVNLVMRESLTGMMVIRAFNTQQFEEDRFDEANTELTNTNLFVNRVMAFLMPVMMFVMNGVTILIVWVGANEIANANMQVGDMMAFMQYAIQIIMAFLFMTMMFILIPRASVAANRIVEVLDTEIGIVDPESPKTFNKGFKGVVKFDDVSFKYPGAEENMLKSLNFTAKPGETTAIIGSTGSGKTTLVNLIPRLYDVTGGRILIDGQDIREVTQHDLREHIGYIPQKASLFSGDIKSNMLFANEKASPKEMLEAIDIAQATKMIEEKEDGMDSHIAQGGGNVSGGQKQRLSIARALIKHPEIYVFDDSFSALDFKTDKALRKALKEKTGDSTLIIVAQRISTIRNAEQIIVLEDGNMVGIGTHDALMKDCKTYQEIAYSQLSEEELA